LLEDDWKRTLCVVTEGHLRLTQSDGIFALADTVMVFELMLLDVLAMG